MLLAPGEVVTGQCRSDPFRRYANLMGDVYSGCPVVDVPEPQPRLVVQRRRTLSPHAAPQPVCAQRGMNRRHGDVSFGCDRGERSVLHDVPSTQPLDVELVVAIRPRRATHRKGMALLAGGGDALVEQNPANRLGRDPCLVSYLLNAGTVINESAARQFRVETPPTVAYLDAVAHQCRPHCSFARTELGGDRTDRAAFGLIPSAEPRRVIKNRRPQTRWARVGDTVLAHRSTYRCAVHSDTAGDRLDRTTITERFEQPLA